MPDAALHGGSTGTPAGSLAIVDNSTVPAQGAWQFSTDGGTTWQTVPGGLSGHVALVLDASDYLRFVPAFGFSGSIPGLSARIADSRVTGAGTLQDISGTTGGSGTWSSGVASINGNVDAAPPAAVTPALPYPFLTNPPAPVFFRSDISDAPDTRITDRTGVFGHGRDADVGGYGEHWLTGGYVYRFAEVDHFSALGVPVDSFHTDDPEILNRLEYSARREDGGQLPPWLSFDTRSLTFVGTPPEGSEGLYDLVVIARDRGNMHAETHVRILVSQRVDSLLDLALSLKQPERIIPSQRGEPSSMPLPRGALGLPDPRRAAEVRKNVPERSTRSGAGGAASVLARTSDAGVRNTVKRILGIPVGR